MAFEHNVVFAVMALAAATGWLMCHVWMGRRLNRVVSELAVARYESSRVTRELAREKKAHLELVFDHARCGPVPGLAAFRKDVLERIAQVSDADRVAPAPDARQEITALRRAIDGVSLRLGLIDLPDFTKAEKLLAELHERVDGLQQDLQHRNAVSGPPNNNVLEFTGG